MRKALVLVLTILAVIALHSAGLSQEQSLTITLDSPAGSPQDSDETKTDLSLKHETLGATRESASKQQAKTTESADKKEAAIGRVGIVTASKANIRRYPSSKGSVVFTCPKNTYLAVLGYNGDWYGILMEDSSTGWIEKKYVELLDYEVVGQKSTASTRGSRIINTALQYLGIRYKWGGNTASGIDCSGFVKSVFARHGVSLPRVSRDQARVGTPVGWRQLQAGDRLYFACKGSQVDHTGIYMGNGHFIHSSAGRGGVAIDSLTKPFWMNTLVAARRD